MAFTHDLETAKVKYPQAIDALVDVADKKIPKDKDLLDEASKEAGAAKLTKLCGECSAVLDAMHDMIHKLVGEDGDSALNGTMYGGVSYIKKTDEAMNGV